MSSPDPRFASMNAAVVDDFRAHSGVVTSGPFVGRPVLLLTTLGARSGEPRLVPLVYSRDGDRIVIVASKAGAPTDPSWYLNLVACPTVTVEIGAETYQAHATVAEGAERDRLYAQHAAQNPTFVAYQERTTRRIPVVLLERIY